MIGSVSEEGNSMASRPTVEEWRANLIKAYGEDKGKALAGRRATDRPSQSEPFSPNAYYIFKVIGSINRKGRTSSMLDWKRVLLLLDYQ